MQRRTALNMGLWQFKCIATLLVKHIATCLKIIYNILHNASVACNGFFYSLPFGVDNCIATLLVKHRATCLKIIYNKLHNASVACNGFFYYLSFGVDNNQMAQAHCPKQVEHQWYWSPWKNHVWAWVHVWCHILKKREPKKERK